ncbi:MULTISPECIES: ABC-three component system middle component 4 [Aeromonas]|uniref:ABC-three component system middle component 4 n=1 Tax=Aeromonas TaxID=642 RepID=UPI0011186041|nr:MULTISPECIES: ABC-three component system middle component 4 [Aeromonas]MCX4036935.1 hypothetical protein [Aeromonas caviae]TNI83014.1 hypothetical protein CF119_16195 [Aeromonas sobria]
MNQQPLPYLLIDDDFSLNLSLVVMIIKRHSLSSKKNAVLDFEKLQIFLYLTKNPSKINSMLSLAGKKIASISSQYTYTIESLSTNVDMLFDRSKLKTLLRELAARGLLACEFDSKDGTLKYLLSNNGELFFQSIYDKKSIIENECEDTLNSITQNYFHASMEVIDSLSALQSQTNSKLNYYLSNIFRRN